MLPSGFFASCLDDLPHVLVRFNVILRECQARVMDEKTCEENEPDH